MCHTIAPFITLSCLFHTPQCPHIFLFLMCLSGFTQHILKEFSLPCQQFHNQQDRQCTYTRNIQAHSRNYHYRGKAASVTYSKCVSAALVIQHTMHINHIVICGLSGSTIFLYLISWHNFWKKFYWT
jgi:hypothetical protein